MKILQNSELGYTIGNNIKRLRFEAGLMWDDIFVQLKEYGIEMNNLDLSRIEMGVEGIRVEVLVALAQILHVKVGDFFEGISLKKINDQV